MLIELEVDLAILNDSKIGIDVPLAISARLEQGLLLSSVFSC